MAQEARCQDCGTPFELNARGPKKRYCGNVILRTGCVYRRWRDSIDRSNKNRKSCQPRQERLRFEYKQDIYEEIYNLWEKRGERTSLWIAEVCKIPLAEANWYIAKICKQVDYGD